MSSYNLKYMMTTQKIWMILAALALANFAAAAEKKAAPGEPVQRIGLQRWVQRLWKEKDAELDALLQAEPPAAS